MATAIGLRTPKTPRFSHSSKEFPQSLATSKIRVVVRIRPFLPSEAGNVECSVPCVFVLNEESDNEVTVHIKDQGSSRNECYKLDSFYGQDENLSLIFNKEVLPVIPGIFHGSNAAIFAYGATGSGKTYTMQGSSEQLGIVPLSLSAVFSLCEEKGCAVDISYYEVYMDRCFDLLEPKAKEIKLLEDREGQVQPKGLSLVCVKSMAEFDEIFSSGVQRRKVAHTSLNDVSSRSHGILTITVSRLSENSEKILLGKLNLIDLAGNEDNRRSGNGGLHLQESAKINQSLFALSNVIYALNNNEPRVPYRESKLTRILQDSLGGRSRALMIACLNPGSYQEAVHTVSLAARSRQIVNYVNPANKQETPKVKIDMEQKLRSWLESKGKTKKNTPAFRVPISGKTSSSFHLPKSTCSESLMARGGRKLFDSGTRPTVASESKEERLQTVDDDTDKMSTIREDLASESKPSNINAPLDLDQLKSPNETSVLDIEVQEPPSRDIYAVNPSSYILEESSSNMEKKGSSIKFVESPPLSERIRSLERNLRRVLSPINSNIKTTPCASSNGRLCLVFLDSKTPQTPHILACSNEEDDRVTGTPLDIFNARSSKLKGSLVQEYIEFLNTASKEELMCLKWIGEKRAEHIVQLRKENPQPIKTLSDLEKMGLSSKQVNDMFRRVASGIFI